MSSKARTTAFPAFLALFAGSCGVEVGNPHPKPSGGKSGALTLALADAPVDSAKHVYFNIVGLRATPILDDGTSGEPVSVALQQFGKIDALALNNGKTLPLSTASALPVGTYAGVVLDLDEEAPGTVVEADDSEHPLRFPDAGKGIFVGQGFEVVEGEELSVTLHVDLRRSLKEMDDGGGRRFDFGPVAHMVRKGDDGKILGAGLSEEAAVVCAYLRRKADFGEGRFGKLPPKGGKGPNDPGNGEGLKGGAPGAKGHDGPGDPDGPATEGSDAHRPELLLGGTGPVSPPPPVGESGGDDDDGEPGKGEDPNEGRRPKGPAPHNAKLPPSVGPDDLDVVLDADAGCANAFATAKVEGGTFNLSHLWPGLYQLQIFTADGLQVEALPKVDLKPGETFEYLP